MPGRSRNAAVSAVTTSDSGCGQTGVVRAPGQIIGVLLYRGWHVWRWEIYDSVGLWRGVLTVPLAASLEEAGERLAIHVARHWNGQELPRPWEPIGEDLWSAGEPLSVVVEEDDRPQDASYDWPSVYRSGDVVRLDDGRVGIVSIMDYAPGTAVQVGTRRPRHRMVGRPRPLHHRTVVLPPRPRGPRRSPPGRPPQIADSHSESALQARQPHLAFILATPPQK
jgi:hypothetical protein